MCSRLDVCFYRGSHTVENESFPLLTWSAASLSGGGPEQRKQRQEQAMRGERNRTSSLVAQRHTGDKR